MRACANQQFKHIPMSFPCASLCWMARRFCKVDSSNRFLTVLRVKSVTIAPAGSKDVAIVEKLQVKKIKTRVAARRQRTTGLIFVDGSIRIRLGQTLPQTITLGLLIRRLKRLCLALCPALRPAAPVTTERDASRSGTRPVAGGRSDRSLVHAHDIVRH